MFVRPSAILFSVIALVGVAIAAPTDLEVRGSGTCNSGTVQCCNSIQDSSSSEIQQLFHWLSLVPPVGGTQIGLTCSSLGIASSSSCTQQTVCCEGNVFFGVGIACSPITININL